MTISGFLCLVMSSKAAGFARLAYYKQPSPDLGKRSYSKQSTGPMRRDFVIKQTADVGIFE